MPTKLEQLFSLSKGCNRTPSLVEIQKLCTQYGNPELAFKTVHVAGTNGKGSVCTKMAECLAQGGYKVGLYTSPHISSYCERIRINGKMIPEEEVESLLEDIPLTANFFEITTLLAFLYFRKQKVDISIIETGLGGRWDATNVVQPEVSVITSIGLDHTELLGSTIEKISWEKAGIIKKGVPVVIGPDVSRILLPKDAQIFQSPQMDDYDLENSEIARLALDLLSSQFPLASEAVAKGLQMRPPCRFQIIGDYVLDVAHNPHGFIRLIEKLKTHFPNRDYRFIVGFSKGKDISGCANLIEEAASYVHLVPGSHFRLAQVEEIRPYFTRPIIETSMQDAILRPYSEVVVIAGSFFIMQDAQAALALKI